MTLISLLIILTIERLALRGEAWQIHRYFKLYAEATIEKSGMQSNTSFLVISLWLLFPSLLVAGFLFTLDSFVIDILVSLFVLAVCIGCRELRKTYKEYLNAANRGDLAAVDNYAKALGQLTDAEGQPIESLGQTLVWLNFRYYCAVMFWFVALGAPGALFYVMARQSFDYSLGEKAFQALVPHSHNLARLTHGLEWLPARIFSFGYLIIGNFTRGTGTWLSYILDFDVSSRTVVSNIAAAAESVASANSDCTLEPCCMVKLVKRNLLFFLALVALITLYGGLR